MSGAFAIHEPTATRAGASNFEIAFLVAGGVALATQAVQVFFRGDLDYGGVGGSPVASYIFASFYAGVAVLLLGRRRAVIATALRSPLIVLIISFPVLSLLWSVNRGQSISPAIAVTGSSLLGLYLAARFDLRQIIVLVALVYAVAGMASAFLALFVPGMGIMGHGPWAGAWSGLYVHKNSLGAGSAIGALVLFYALTLTRGPIRAFFLAGLAATLLCLVQTRSATAVVNTAMLIMIMGWARLAQTSPGRTIPLTVAGFGLLFLALLQVLLISGLDPFLKLVGRNGDLSGRLPLWQITLEYIANHPWLGYGYEAFWSRFSSEVEFIATVVHYHPFYSHNGALETLLNGGVVLLSLILLAYGLAVARALALLLRGQRSFHTSFPLVFLAFFLIANITESRVLFANDLTWSLFVTLSAVLAGEVRVRLGAASATRQAELPAH